MDFRNVTNLFADPDFDGDPVMIKQVSEDDDLSGTEDETNDGPIIDGEDGDEVEFPDPKEYPTIEGGGDVVEEPRVKIRVDGVRVQVVNERVQYLGADGKIISEDIKDYTKKNITSNFNSLNDFLNHWNKADQKRAIIQELEEQGVFFDALKEEVGKDFDPFDLICHVAFEAKPLTRKERAENVKKRNYFAKYGEKAQAVIQSLLDKYSDDGLVTIESTEVLKLDPLNKLGTPVELIKAFGTKANYLEALKELEQELYKTA
jgi:type I restriction enzyme R subunit